MRFSLALLVAASLPRVALCDVDYNRDVRPILVDNCYACHGPDAAQRKAGLQLDLKDTALAQIKSGGYAIVPGDVGRSVLVTRVTAADSDDLMPPVDSGKSLTTAQIEVLRQWIEEGAQWSQHWSFVPPTRPAPPTVRNGSWARNSIDRFIQSKLEREGLRPSEMADAVTLFRRLNFDLLGLPPAMSEVESFVNDHSPGAFERRVDRLLESPHFGERMAVFWLDLVRFADTRGYHSDNPRNVSPYRDYVLGAFNRNRRFDEFTVEQLAGDLLESASLDQRVASAYNKLLQTTEEGGAQPGEYEAKNVSDRVRNVSVVWMGATLGCAECHDHKFDPYGTRDFYSLGAFFADVKEASIMDHDAGIPVPEADARKELARLRPEIEGLKKTLEVTTAEIANAQIVWETEAMAAGLGPWQVIGPFLATDEGAAWVNKFPPEAELERDKKVDLDAVHQTKDNELRWTRRDDVIDGTVYAFPDSKSATYLHRTIAVDADGSITLNVGSDGGVRVWVNGKQVHEKPKPADVESERHVIRVPIEKGTNDLDIKLVKGAKGYRFFFEHVGGDWVPDAIHRLLAKPGGERDASEGEQLAAYYRSLAPLLDGTRASLALAEKRHKEIVDTARRCLVTVSASPRTVRVLPRGNWMDKSGEVVEPAIPAYFGTLETNGQRATRLDLARWLVSKNNPLGARVLVNRLWKLFFGKGISSRLEDLGAMGEPPVHAELLDWLCVELVESGWNLKHIVRLLVSSATYRQSSIASAELRERDPYNRWVARQSSWRLDAESVRDNVLVVSGLLTRKIGGPSVRPHQPAGYWSNLNFPVRRWEAHAAPECYRRGVYTWWQRSFMHPAMMAFDAPSREECMGERPRSNIPQQALVLLNDPSFVEAGRALAERILKEGGTSSVERLRWAYGTVLSRAPELDEVTVLDSLLEKHQQDYGSDLESARQLVNTGHSKPSPDLDVVELAAWTSVSRAILNLHESVTRN